MTEHARAAGQTGLPSPGGTTRAGAGRRVAVGAAALALPLLGLVALRLSADLDVQWQHDRTHFWIVLGAALVSAVTAYGTGAAAVRRGDVRVMYVSIAFLSAAGFLGLHALATPHMILDTASAGFNSSTPVGIAVGSLFAVASTREVPSGRAAVEMRRARRWRVALLVLMGVWGLASLLRLPPFDAGPGPERGSWPILAATALAVVLFAVSALTYARLWWRRGGLLPAAMASAMVLLAEAMVAVTVAPNWHLSWWEWHVLMLAAFVLVAWGAQQSWHEERWAALYTADTLAGRREMSILFADLKGFTTFSEAHDPAEVTQMLNAYFTVAIPAVVERHGGTIDRLIGDTVNVASRIEGQAPVGGVAVTADTLALLPGATTEPLGALELKGKAEPVEAFVLMSLG